MFTCDKLQLDERGRNMITYIRGKLTEIEEGVIIVEAYGVGYEIMVPGSVLSGLPAIGNEVIIYTYQNVKEDALDLYGFNSKEDLKVFKLLITVNGIGPKAALSILSSITPDDLRIAIISEDVKRIQSAPGIGAKTAQRLIVELKDKFDIEDVIYKPVSGSDIAVSSGVRDEACEALTSLGYSASEALRAVNGVEINEDMDSETVLKLALKKLAFM